MSDSKNRSSTTERCGAHRLFEVGGGEGGDSAIGLGAESTPTVLPPAAHTPTYVSR